MIATQITSSRNWVLPLILAFAVVLSACGGQAPSGGEPGGIGGETGSGGETGGDTEVATEAPEGGAASEVCANQYYPVAENLTRTYFVTGASEDFGYEEIITGVTSEGFTLNISYNVGDGLQVTQHWACQTDGIVALDYNGGVAAALSTEGLSGQFTTTGVTGVTVPANLAVGSTWSQSLNVEGDIALAEGMSGHATGSVSYSANAIGTESVTTAAGTFDAIKVEMEQVFDATADIGGISMPLTFSGTATTWYAAGIGMVKSVQSEDLMGTTITIELQTYAIP